MHHILWPLLSDNVSKLPTEYISYLTKWLEEIKECIEHENIAISQCVTAFIAEQFLYGSNKIPWDIVLSDLLSDENGKPLAYSERFGKRLYKFGNQWRQSPIYAIYNHYWLMSKYGLSANKYADLISVNVQPSGWIYAKDVSPTNIRTRMRSELMMNMAMGCEVLRAAGRLDSYQNNLKATLSNTPPTLYLSAEFFRLEALRILNASHLFVTNCNEVLDKCRLEKGFCDFNVTDKIDDYMGTKKRTARDRMIPSPLSTLHALGLTSLTQGRVHDEALACIARYRDLLSKEPFDIPAFKIRDLEYDFGSGVTAGEVIAAILLHNHSDEVKWND